MNRPTGLRCFIVDLALPPEECMRYYSGEASVVVARARDGSVIQFPARLLRRFIGRDGVAGAFELACDADSRLVAMERIGEKGA
ncbi:MAG: DUF2835 domain-containing protein [Gammaproteobacteria bacterium]|jgi:hypothetical protein|nr:DUF2835 domain-containing protein [Gammaproteobacteria bacterium]